MVHTAVAQSNTIRLPSGDHDRVDSQGDNVIIPEAIPNHRFTLGQLAVAEARWSGGRLVFESSYQVSSSDLSRIEPIRKRTDVGIVVPEFFPENALNLIPNVSVTGLDPISGSQPWPRQYLNHALSAALTWQRGSHESVAGRRSRYSAVDESVV